MGAVYLVVGVGLVLGVMVLIHEWGHFIVARMCGVRVDVFSIGFGPRLFGWKKGPTDYRVSALPLGGYVRMAGTRSFRSGFRRQAANGCAGRVDEQAQVAASANLVRWSRGESGFSDIPAYGPFHVRGGTVFRISRCPRENCRSASEPSDNEPFEGRRHCRVHQWRGDAELGAGVPDSEASDGRREHQARGGRRRYPPKH